MALIDKASLLMVPSTYEAGKLYNVLPSGNRAPDNKGGAGYDQTRADFDFDRGSNAAATRINSSGLIEKYRENLLLQSNNFGTTWGIQNASVTSGQSGYDGSINAWLFSHSSSTAFLFQGKSLSASINTISIYAKQGTSLSTRLDFVTGSFAKGASCTFDLVNGTAGSVTHYGSSSGFISGNATSVGNGWYRISLTGVTTAETWYHELALTSGNIYIQSAQLETGLVATDVLTSGATTAKSGVLIDLPRINYDANGENGALLLEPSRQQLIQFSEYFNSSYWIKGGAPTVSITDNAGISPEGISNATRFVAASAATSTRLYTAITWTAVPHTLSLYVKNNGGTNKDFRFSYYDGSGQYFSPTFTLTDEWQRIEYTFTPTASSGGFWLVNTPIGGLNLDLLAYGAMLEQNASYKSSYIPNHGTSGGVTRAADSCSVTGASDVIGGTSGTIFFDIKTNKTLTSTNYKQFFYYSGVNSASSYMYISGNNYIVGNPSLGNVVSGTQLEADTQYKVAITYKQNDFKLYINGSLSATRTSGSVIDAVDITSIGSYNGVSEFNEFQFNQYAHFQEVLSDSELATLTTL